MRIGSLCALLAAAPVLVAPAFAQDGETIALDLRVTSVRPGFAEVDRGSIDGLAVGDRVQFFPREGGLREGTVVEVGERRAAVELHDPSAPPTPGTRGEVRVPRSRRVKPPKPVEPEHVPVPAPVPVPVNGDGEPVAREEPVWPDDDAEWTQGQPLLAEARPVRPEERAPSMAGRWYVIADQIMSSEDDRSDAFYRVGTSLEYENLWGKGERLYFDGELNYRNTDVPDQDDDQGVGLRLDRLSLALGGTRFASTGVEFGRFMHSGMPEFGLLDGVEWGQRTSGGDRFGFSAGFLPEPDEHQETGSDLQFAGYYRWVHDESEVFSAAGGYQKTFHHTDADRDLFVGNISFLPPEGWTFFGSAWVDYYTAGDVNKGAGPELTQAYANASRRYDDGSSLHVVYTHMAFPEIDQEAFLPVQAAQLANDRNDRLALSGRTRFGDDSELHGGAGVWKDEDEDGWDVDVGLLVDELIVRDGFTDATVFGTWGRFNSTAGTRLAFGARTDTGSWSAEYEFAQHHLDGFDDDNDELPQHRARLAFETHRASGWSVSVHVDVGLWDHENALGAGLYVQKSF